MVIVSSMDEIAAVLEALCEFCEASPGLSLVRIKERFAQSPSPGGWRDLMLNIELAKPPHICELQVVHHEMLVARNGLPGHSVYNAVRNCTELLEYAGVGTADGRSRRIGKLAAGRSAEGLGKLAGTGMQTLPLGIPISQIRLQYPHGLAASLLLPDSASLLLLPWTGM